MRRSFVALTVCLASVPPISNAARAETQGELGDPSRATLRISVSVAPAFQQRVQAGRPGAARALELSSNAPGLRYTVVASPLRRPGGGALPTVKGEFLGADPVPLSDLGSPARSDDSSRAGGLLVLIVPD